MPPAPPSSPAAPLELRTERLLLRRWRPDDAEPFAALNADPRVMRHFPAPLSREHSDDLARRIAGDFDLHGYGRWALEVLATGTFIGFAGLAPMHPGSPGAGGVEVGWRLAASAWGQGLATEAARASLADGIRRLGLERVWSWTAVTNLPSQAVMRRLGMREHSRLPHPELPPGHRLSEHVVYVLDTDVRA